MGNSGPTEDKASFICAETARKQKPNKYSQPTDPFGGLKPSLQHGLARLSFGYLSCSTRTKPRAGSKHSQLPGPLSNSSTEEMGPWPLQMPGELLCISEQHCSPPHTCTELKTHRFSLITVFPTFSKQQVRTYCTRTLTTRFH